MKNDLPNSPAKEILKLADQLVDQAGRIVRTLPGEHETQIVPYRSYGTRERLIVKGRLLANKPVEKPSATDSTFRNGVNMLKRWLTHEVSNTEVRARFGSREYYDISDAEGYFEFDIPGADGFQPSELWQEVMLDLPDNGRNSAHAVTAKVLVPPADAEFGVVSDIDDTVIYTAATDLLKMAKTVLLGNAYSRLPFKGVAAFYRGLSHGSKRRGENNPIFYVSSSPWNLYDVLRDLFEVRSIPAGPLILQDFGIETNKLGHVPHKVHKIEAIDNIIRTYPALKFILVGDSGQADPEIYHEIVHRFSDRVLAVYIRDVSIDPARESVVQKLAAEIREKGCDIIFAEETIAAAVHAVDRGWIQREVLDEINKEKAFENAS